MDYRYKKLLNKYKYIKNIFNKPLKYEFKLKANERFIIFFIFDLITILFLKFISLESKYELVYNILFFISIILLICFIVIMFYIDFKHKDLTEALLKSKEKYQLYTNRYMLGFIKKQKDFNEIQNLRQQIGEMEHIISNPKPYDTFSILVLVLLGFGSVLVVAFALYTLYLLNIEIYKIIHYIFCIIIAVFGLFILKNLIKKFVNFYSFLFPTQFLDFINSEFNAVKIRNNLFSIKFFTYQVISLALYSLCFCIIFTIYYICSFKIDFYVAIFSCLFANTIKIFLYKKNFCVYTFLCVFIYLIIIITIGKFIFLIFYVPGFLLSNMQNILTRIHNDSGEGEIHQTCMVKPLEGEHNTFTEKVLDKIWYFFDSEIKSFLFLFSKDYRAPVLPNWAWDYAKAPALKYVEANCIVEQKYLFTNSHGRVDLITDRFKISSKGDIAYLDRKRINIRTITLLQEIFYMKEPIKDCKNFNFIHKTRPCQNSDDYIDIYPIRKNVYTLSLNKQVAYDTISKGFIKLNRINTIDEHYRYETLGIYRGLWKTNAIFRTTINSVDVAVSDILYISNLLLKEIYPRLCLLWTQPYSTNRILPGIVEEHLLSYENYKSRLSYLYTYHKDIFIKIPSLDLPRYYCYHDAPNNERADSFIHHLNHIIREGFFIRTLPYMSAYDYPFPNVTENFANLGKIWFVTSEGNYIKRDIRSTPVIEEDDINWLHIKWNKDKLSKALGFYHNESYINASQRYLLPFYSPNNLMGVSYDRVIYLIEKVRIINKINTPVLYRF